MPANLSSQAGHGARVAQAHYAVDSAFLHRLGPELITAYEQASVAWHRLFDLSSYGRGPTRSIPPKHGRVASQQIGPARKRGRADPGLHGRVQDGLVLLYGPDACARSPEQAQALDFISRQPPAHSIIILPTSAGKSVIFFLIAALCPPSRFVIVVVPFVALVDDVIARGRAHGLQVTTWQSSQTNEPETAKVYTQLQQLIVVSADQAVGNSFRQYAKECEERGELQHLFFDECHVVLTDVSYRQRLRDLWKLRYLNCPFTGLTATLMPRLEKVLTQALLVEDATIFRRSTARRTLRYRVVDSGDNPPSEVTLALIDQQPLPAGKRGVIYVRGRATGHEVAKALGCPFYHARADERGELLTAWRAGPGGWMVATGALGTGINIEGIQMVIHVGWPYGLTSFVQQSGRGGRSGEVSDSILVVRVDAAARRAQQDSLGVYSTEGVDEEALTAYACQPGCRRRVLGEYMDGEAVDCARIDGVLCDHCVSSLDSPDTEMDTSTARVSMAPRPQARLQQHAQADQALYRVMCILQQECLFCLLTQSLVDEGSTHDYQSCARANAQQAGPLHYQAWRRTIDLGRYDNCWTCGLSQEICPQSTAKSQGQEECEFRDIMLIGLFVLEHQQFVWRLAGNVGFAIPEYAAEWDKASMARQREMKQAWAKWLVRRDEERWESNWMRLWRYVCSQVEPVICPDQEEGNRQA